MAVKHKDAVKRIFAGYVIDDCKNSFFKSEVPSDWASVWVTNGLCSCDFYSYPIDPEIAAEKFRKKFSKLKYRKKGWSEDRINREIMSILNRPNNEGGLSEPFFHCLREYTKEMGNCYVFIAWYRGDVNKEGIAIQKQLEYSISNGAGKASEIHENILYKFT